MMDYYSFEMFSLSEASLLLYVQSCIAAQDDPAVHEEGLVWAERLRSRTLMRAMEHNFKKDPLMGTPKFDSDMQAALRTLKDLSISCQGVIFVEYALTDNEILIWVIKSGSIVLRRRSYATAALALAFYDQAQNSWGLNDMQLERKDELLRKANQMIGLNREGVRAFINVAVENVKNSFKADFYLQLLGSFLLGPISEDLARVTKDQCIVFIPHEVSRILADSLPQQAWLAYYTFCTFHIFLSVWREHPIYYVLYVIAQDLDSSSFIRSI